MTTVITFDEPKLEQQKLVPDDITAWFPEPDDITAGGGSLIPMTSPQGFSILVTAQRDLDIRWVSLYQHDPFGPPWHNTYTHHKAPTGSVRLCLSADMFLKALHFQLFLKHDPNIYVVINIHRTIVFLYQGQTAFEL